MYFGRTRRACVSGRTFVLCVRAFEFTVQRMNTTNCNESSAFLRKILLCDETDLSASKDIQKACRCRKCRCPVRLLFPFLNAEHFCEGHLSSVLAQTVTRPTYKPPTTCYKEATDIESIVLLHGTSIYR